MCSAVLAEAISQPVQAGFAALTGQRDGRFAMTPFFTGLWAAIAASGLVAALLHGSAAFPASALADHRSETLACALDELGVPYPWGVTAAISADEPFTARWAAASVAAGFFLPTEPCLALFNMTVTSSRETRERAFECASGLMYSGLAFAPLWRGGRAFRYRMYGGLDNALRLSWGAVALASGYDSRLLSRRVSARALRLVSLFALGAAEAERFGYIIAVQIELLLSTPLLEDAPRNHTAPAQGESLEIYDGAEHWWHSGHVVDSRGLGFWWWPRAHLVNVTGRAAPSWVELCAAAQPRVDPNAPEKCLAWRRHDELRTPAGVQVPLIAYFGLAALAMVTVRRALRSEQR